MTISWDTSLFHAPYLPYSQGHFGIAYMDAIAFSQFDTGLGFGMYNMLTSDSVTIDFLADFLFQIPVYFGPVDETGVPEESTSKGQLKIWPNPAQETVRIEFPERSAKEVTVSELSGRQLIRLENVNAYDPLDISMLASGTYIISIRTNQNYIHHGTFEKIP